MPLTKPTVRQKIFTGMTIAAGNVVAVIVLHYAGLPTTESLAVLGVANTAAMTFLSFLVESSTEAPAPPVPGMTTVTTAAGVQVRANPAPSGPQPPDNLPPGTPPYTPGLP